MRWLGWGAQWDTWEDAKNVHDPQLVAALRARRRAPATAPAAALAAAAPAAAALAANANSSSTAASPAASPAAASPAAALAAAEAAVTPDGSGDAPPPRPVSRPPPLRVCADEAGRAVHDSAKATAALLTAAAYGPVTPTVFIAVSDVGLGLFARAPLRKGESGCEDRGCDPVCTEAAALFVQAASLCVLAATLCVQAAALCTPGESICKYEGPRVPTALHRRGIYVLKVPRNHSANPDPRPCAGSGPGSNPYPGPGLSPDSGSNPYPGPEP